MSGCPMGAKSVVMPAFTRVITPGQSTAARSARVRAEYTMSRATKEFARRTNWSRVIVVKKKFDDGSVKFVVEFAMTIAESSIAIAAVITAG
jgi:hypothetical protein